MFWKIHLPAPFFHYLKELKLPLVTKLLKKWIWWRFYLNLEILFWFWFPVWRSRKISNLFSPHLGIQCWKLSNRIISFLQINKFWSKVHFIWNDQWFDKFGIDSMNVCISFIFHLKRCLYCSLVRGPPNNPFKTVWSQMAKQVQRWKWINKRILF